MSALAVAVAATDTAAPNNHVRALAAEQAERHGRRLGDYLGIDVDQPTGIRVHTFSTTPAGNAA